jgi:hypothetical protein
MLYSETNYLKSWPCGIEDAFALYLAPFISIIAALYIAPSKNHHHLQFNLRRHRLCHHLPGLPQRGCLVLLSVTALVLLNVTYT